MISSKTKIGLFVLWHIVAVSLLTWTAKPRIDDDFVFTFVVYSLISIEVGLIYVWGGLIATLRAKRGDERREGK